MLIPVFMTLVFVRLSMDAHKSRGRIKLLEADESYRERLAEVVGKMEKRIEDVVVDYMDDPGASVSRNAEPSSATMSPGSTATLTATVTTGSGKEVATTVATAQMHGLTALQQRMVKALNALPKLEKQLAFIDIVHNSHAVIIARDVKRFEHHSRGHGVLRHLADHLLL